MTELKLEIGEGILLQTNDAGLYDGNNEIDIDELYLTNKNIIYVHEKSISMFKSETVVDRIPLSSIAVIDGVVQITQVDDDDYGKSLQMIYTNGKRELLELNVSPKKQYPVWKDEISNAVLRLTTGAPAPQVINTPPTPVTPPPVQEEKNETAFAGASLFAGFKGVVDTAKQTFKEVAQTATEAFNGVSETPSNQAPITNEETIMEEKKYIYCCNCGEKLIAGSKFCNACGTPTGTIKQEPVVEPVATPIAPPPVQESVVEPITERKTVYEGNLHKCPNCGEVLNSFVTNCPTCGHEIRGAQNTSSVKEFAAKLEAIEAGREQRKSNPLKTLYFGQSVTKTDEQKISLIRSFAIPNTKEDLYEFLILSVSNIDVDSYQNDNQLRNDARKELSDAWKAKFEQAYQKAKLMFADDPKFAEIEKLYNSTNTSIKKAKWKVWKILGIVYGILIAIIAVSLILGFSLSASSEKKEIQRLENIVSQIEIALENGEYKLALMNADSLDFNGNDSGLERDWEIKREYWIDKVMDEAAENGVTLERPADKPIEEDETPSNNNSSTNNKDENFSNKEQTHTGSFNATNIIKQLKVTEHRMSDLGDYYTMLIIENPTQYNLSITADAKFYNKSGKLVGAESDEIYAFEKGTKTIMIFSADEEYDRMDYEFTVKEEDYYDCIISSLKYETVRATEKEILSVTIKGNIPAEFVEVYALFFKNGKLVDYDWTYMTDDDSEIKPNKTITEEIDCYEEYDKVEFYFTGRAEKE